MILVLVQATTGKISSRGVAPCGFRVPQWTGPLSLGAQPVTGVTGVTRVTKPITMGILAVTRAAETCDKRDNPSHAGPA